MVTTFIDIDVNCPTCFNNVVEALRATPGVNSVGARVSEGCLEVSHEIDEAQLRDIVTRTGRTIEVAGNGEYVMGVASAVTEHNCGLHS